MQQMYGYFFGAILRTFALHSALFGFCNAMTLCFVGKMTPLQNTQLKMRFSPFFLQFAGYVPRRSTLDSHL